MQSQTLANMRSKNCPMSGGNEEHVGHERTFPKKKE